MYKSNAANIFIYIYNAIHEMGNITSAPASIALFLLLPFVLALSLRCIFSHSKHFIVALAQCLCIGFLCMCMWYSLFAQQKKSHTKMPKICIELYSVSTQTKSRMFHCTSERSNFRPNERTSALTESSFGWLKNKLIRNTKFLVPKSIVKFFVTANEWKSNDSVDFEVQTQKTNG